jgi:hypothetical protein
MIRTMLAIGCKGRIILSHTEVDIVREAARNGALVS